MYHDIASLDITKYCKARMLASHVRVLMHE